MTNPVRFRPTGEHGARQSRTVVLLTFWVALALVCVASVVLVIVREVDPPAPRCPPPQSCPGPPLHLPPSQVRTWTSASLGVSLRYPTAVFAVDERTDTTLRLHVRDTQAAGVDASVWITAQPASAGVAEELANQRRDDLATTLLGLTEDDNPDTIVPDPQIGGFHAAGGSFRATADTPQGPSESAIVLIAAATRQSTTVVVSYVVTGTDDVRTVLRLRTLLSPILVSVAWKA